MYLILAIMVIAGLSVFCIKLQVALIVEEKRGRVVEEYMCSRCSSLRLDWLEKADLTTSEEKWDLFHIRWDRINKNLTWTTRHLHENRR